MLDKDFFSVLIILFAAKFGTGNGSDWLLHLHGGEINFWRKRIRSLRLPVLIKT